MREFDVTDLVGVALALLIFSFAGALVCITYTAMTGGFCK